MRKEATPTPVTIPVNHSGEFPGKGMTRFLRIVRREFWHLLPPVIFFAISFNLILFSMNLIMSDYVHRIGSFLLATMAALVVGKAILVADMMPFLRRFDNAPLIRPILFKTFVYSFFVLLARLIEAFLSYLVDTGKVEGFIPFAVDQVSWDRFLFIQTWILVLFLIYVTASELNVLLDRGELYRILFARRSTEVKPPRR
jgi:hypothetical protein